MQFLSIARSSVVSRLASPLAALRLPIACTGALALAGAALGPAGCGSGASSSAASGSSSGSGELQGGSQSGIDAVQLSSLAVAELPLVPAFSPSTQDYYVRCAAGTNALTVTASAASGILIGASSPTAVTPSASFSETFQLGEGGAAVITANAGSTTTQYWIRCLPANVPQITVTSHADAGTPTSGYYLFGNISSGDGRDAYAMVVDVNGVPVWYQHTPNAYGILNVDNLVPNVISYTTYIAYTFNTVADGQYQLVQLASPEVISTTNTVGIPLDHHELRVLPNGDYMMISDVIRTGVDLTGYTGYTGSDMIDCVVQEISPTGAMVWQWDANDHFDPVQDSTFVGQTGTTDTGTVVADPYHCNAIDVQSNGDLLVSSRHMNSVFYISKSTGAVVWKMGGSSYNKDGAQIIQIQNDPETAFYRQHDVRMNADGTVSLFDDHTEMPGPARGVAYTVDTTTGTATVAWQCAGTVSSTAMGSFRRYSDGTNLIGWGEVSTGTNLVLSDYDDSCNDRLDMQLDAPNISYRAVKVPLTALDINVLRATAGTM